MGRISTKIHVAEAQGETSKWAEARVGTKRSALRLSAMHSPATLEHTLNEENGVLAHGPSQDKVSAHVLAQPDHVRPPRATPTPSCGALRVPHPHPACNAVSHTNTKSHLERPRTTILVDSDGGGPVGTRTDAQSLADLASRHAHQERHLDPCCRVAAVRGTR